MCEYGFIRPVRTMLIAVLAALFIGPSGLALKGGQEAQQVSSHSASHVSSDTGGTENGDALYRHGQRWRLFVDTDKDGLDDADERSALAPLGASPMHADMLVYFCRFSDISAAAVQTAINGAKLFYGRLNVPNPDGRTGINMIVVGSGTADVADRSMADRGDWGGLRNKYLPASWRGRAHFHLFNRGGGGQSDSPGTAGSSGIDGGWAVAVHELGHQLGLSHDGAGFTVQSPLHASLMNYAYNYSFDGSSNAIRFSSGTFASLSMTEQDLEEDLRFDAATLHFLTVDPYRFSVRAAGPGRAQVDWNRNGVFGEHHVRADVNYEGDGVNIRPFVEVGATQCTPWLIATQRNVYVLYAEPGAGFRPVPPASSLPVRLSESRPGRIILRRVSKTGIGRPVEVVSNAVGDPTGAWINNELWIVCPVRSGYALERLGIGSSPDSFTRLSSDLVQDNRGVRPTLASIDGKPVLFFWYRSDLPVSYNEFTVPSGTGHPSLGRERVIAGITSNTNVSIAWLPDSRRIAIAATINGNLPNRVRVNYVQNLTGRTSVVEPLNLVRVSADTVGGTDGPNRAYSRPAIVQVERGALGAASRLDLFYEGLEEGNRHLYTSHQVLDPAFPSGWLETRVMAEWDWVRNPPAVAYSVADRDIVLCIVPAVDGIARCSFTALGIEPGRMGDSDELTYVRNTGLRQSLGH
ncbi:MAG TPA: hypothetical protein VLM38_22055 [Blastocatellia bacterium]|nr:hypothetical protein [Blastocatellia bacterium]